MALKSAGKKSSASKSRKKAPEKTDEKSSRIRKAYLFQNKGNAGKKPTQHQFLSQVKKQPSLEMAKSHSSQNGPAEKKRQQMPNIDRLRATKLSLPHISDDSPLYSGKSRTQTSHMDFVVSVDHHTSGGDGNVHSYRDASAEALDKEVLNPNLSHLYEDLLVRNARDEDVSYAEASVKSKLPKKHEAEPPSLVCTEI